MGKNMKKIENREYGVWKLRFPNLSEKELNLLIEVQENVKHPKTNFANFDNSI